MKAEEILQTINETIADHLNGGKGSGNWGHSGRPGKVGGSGAGGGLGSGGAGKSSAKGPDDLKDDYSKNFRDEASVGSWKISRANGPEPKVSEEKIDEYGDIYRDQQQVNRHEVDIAASRARHQAHAFEADNAKAMYDDAKKDYEAGLLDARSADMIATFAEESYKRARDQMDFMKEIIAHSESEIKKIQERNPKVKRNL